MVGNLEDRGLLIFQNRENLKQKKPSKKNKNSTEGSKYDQHKNLNNIFGYETKEGTRAKKKKDIEIKKNKQKTTESLWKQFSQHQQRKFNLSILRLTTNAGLISVKQSLNKIHLRNNHIL